MPIKLPSVDILLTLAAILSCTPATAEPEDVSSLLFRKTQAFSEASQRGDAGVLKALLDDRVVFVNENGEMSSKEDIVSGATPTPSNDDVRMEVTNWRCEQHGDVAVASFIDSQTKDLHGQVFQARYLSVETWLKDHSSWLMIGSQTIALQVDPSFVTLPTTTLDQYAGTYEATRSFKATIKRMGDELSVSINGAPSTIQRAELRDVFFTPGSPRSRRIFQRDEHGNIVGFISRREGHDIIFRREAAG